MDFYKKIALVASVIFLSFIQHLGAFSIFTVKPNLVFVFILVLSFFEIEFLLYFILVLISYLFLRSGLAIDWSVLVSSGLLFLGYWLAKILPWQQIFNMMFLIILLTIVFYLIISFQFVINNISLLIGEILYNLLWGLIFYSWINYILKNR